MKLIGMFDSPFVRRVAIARGGARIGRFCTEGVMQASAH
jgi:hypothetical protein